MLGYTLRRTLAALPLLWLIWTLTFLVGRLLPGDPLELYVGPRVSQESVERLRRVLGLDDPLPLQYVKQLTATLTGQTVLSTAQGRPVSRILLEAAGPTLLLSSLALAGQFLLGLLLGIISALRRERAADHAISSVALVLYSMPSFLLGLYLVLLLSHRLGWLPPSHMQSVAAASGGLASRLLDLATHLVLPVATLVLGSAAMTIRHVRGSLLEVTVLDFIRTARARGLSEWRVVGRHALRNALLPLITLAGLSLPFLLSGALVVEVIFSWPGLGQVAYNAIRARDYPVIQATTLITAVLVVAGSLLADLAAAALDPRIRLERERP